MKTDQNRWHPGGSEPSQGAHATMLILPKSQLSILIEKNEKKSQFYTPNILSGVDDIYNDQYIY